MAVRIICLVLFIGIPLGVALWVAVTGEGEEIMSRTEMIEANRLIEEECRYCGEDPE